MNKTIKNFTPRAKNFIVAVPEKTEGGILLSETAQDNLLANLSEPQLVIHSAEDCLYKEGDYVLLEAHAITGFLFEDQRYMLIPDYRVLGKVVNYSPKPKNKTTIIQ